MAGINDGGKMKYSEERLKHIHRSDCLNFEQFDKDYNVITASPVIPAQDNELELRPWWEDNSNIVPESEGYRPIALYWLDMINDYFKKESDTERTFVDVGVGKGKPILYNLLVNAPYKEYIGIEMDPNYVEIFQNNLINTSININKPVKVEHINAIDFDFSIDDAIYFFFQPFSPMFFDKLIRKNMENFIKHNNYIVLIKGYEYTHESFIGLKSVFSEGLVHIYRFGNKE